MINKDSFVQEFNRVKCAIEEGKTPVYSELRSAKTMLIELLPSLLIQGIFLVISTLIVANIEVDPIIQTVILLVANTVTQTLSVCVFTIIKHGIRIRKLKRYGIEVNERNIAVLESMEYQSV